MPKLSVEKKPHFQSGESKMKRVSLEQITDLIGFRIIAKNIIWIAINL